MTSNSESTPAKMTVFRALIPLVSMGVLIGVGHMWLEFDIKFVILLSTLIAGLVAKSVGVSLDKMLDAISALVRRAFPALMILIAIGGIVGTWMYSGTVPILIYYGLKLLNPDYLLVTAFIVTALVSTFTGTSWGSAATAGSAFIGIGISLGVPLPMVAGAVLSGAVFGDKVSPVSDTTNISAMAAGIPVYDHIKGMVPNVLIAGVVSAVGFLILGMFYQGSGVESGNASRMIAELGTLYHFNIWMFLPPIIVFAGGYKGYNPIVLMVVSSLAAIVIGFFSQGFTLKEGADAMISGFNVDMFAHIGKNVSNLSEELSILLNRGGFAGMAADAVLVSILSIAFGAIMEVSGALRLLLKLILRGVKSLFGLLNAAFLSGALLNGVSGSAMFSMLTVGQMFENMFDEKKLPRSLLSRTMENSMTMLESLLPWHVTALYMAKVLGVPTLDYLPYAFFNVSGILIFFILGYRTVKRVKA